MSPSERPDQARYWRPAALLWVWWLLCIPASAAALPLSAAFPESAVAGWDDPPPVTVYPQQAIGDAPSATVAEPSVTVAEPSVTVAEPSVTVAEPSATVAEPSVTVAEPSVTVAEFDPVDVDGEVESGVDWGAPLGPLSQAPLCDPTGSSVLAPLPVLPAKDGEIQACWDHEWKADERLQASGHDPPLRRFQALHDEATVVSLAVELGAPEPKLITGRKPTLHPAAGYARGLERPPRG